MVNIGMLFLSQCNRVSVSKKSKYRQKYSYDFSNCKSRKSGYSHFGWLLESTSRISPHMKGKHVVESMEITKRYVKAASQRELGSREIWQTRRVSGQDRRTYSNVLTPSGLIKTSRPVCYDRSSICFHLTTKKI